MPPFKVHDLRSNPVLEVPIGEPARRPAALLRAGVLIAVIALIAGLPDSLHGQKMPSPEPRRGTRVGNLAHDFEMQDLDGRAYRLQEMVGKRVVLLAFWATWCVPCIAEVPRLREVYDKYHEKGLEVLGVIVPISQTREGVRAFSEKRSINYPILWDEDEKTTGRYSVGSVPRNFLIGKDGIIRHASSELPNDFEAMIEKLLLENDPPATPGQQGASS